MWIKLAVTQRHHVILKKTSAADIAVDWNGVPEIDEGRKQGRDYTKAVLVCMIKKKKKKIKIFIFKVSVIARCCKQLINTKSLWWQEREHIKTKGH